MGGRGRQVYPSSVHKQGPRCEMPRAGIRESITLSVLLACCSAMPPQSRLVFLDASPRLDPSQRNLLAHHRAAILPIISALRLRGGMPLPSQIPHEEGWKEERAREKAEREEEARLNADQVLASQNLEEEWDPRVSGEVKIRREREKDRESVCVAHTRACSDFSLSADSGNMAKRFAVPWHRWSVAQRKASVHDRGGGPAGRGGHDDAPSDPPELQQPLHAPNARPEHPASRILVPHSNPKKKSLASNPRHTPQIPNP
jgi:hypothetical protein